MTKKELRPHSIFCNDKERELIAHLITLAAAGVIKIDKSWQEVAIPLHQRLTKLLTKKNVQKNQS